MSDAVEIVKALVSPTEKLIEATRSAIGKAYEPRYTRRMADARAHEIEKIAEAMRNAMDVPVNYNQGSLSINTEDIDEFVKRTKARLLFQEFMKQQNIDSVVDNAYDVLEKLDEVSDEPLDRDWLNRFFNSVGEVSSEQMQKIWGKILAGEIVSPGNFSLRTLDVVKNITSFEAGLFLNISPYVLGGTNEKQLVSDDEILKKYGLVFGIILRLRECGLFHQDGLMQYSVTLTKEEEGCMTNKEYVIVYQNMSDEEVKVNFGVFALTQAGNELIDILDYSPNLDYTIDVAKKLHEMNKKLRVTVHKLLSILPDGTVSYDEGIIQEFAVGE